jgi:peptide/nickel transport system substrate-binding protein
VCQTDEPVSLYLYGDDARARAGVFAALYDGPIDSVGYSYQPVILDGLPSVAAGSAGLRAVEVQAGDRVLDAATGAVVPLVAGVRLAQIDGSTLDYGGDGPATTLQTWAEFRLLPGLRWSDGEPLLAEDSVFSYQVAASPDTPVSRFVLDRTASYEAVDERSLRWTGLPGWRDSDFAVRFWSPLPRHLYQGYSPAELLNLPQANEHPLGWGPFVMAPNGWVKGSQLSMVRNPEYFRADEGLPSLDGVLFRFGLDPQTISDDLLSGACHVAPPEVDLSAQLPALRQAEQAGRVVLHQATDNAFEHLDFGIRPADGYRRPAGTALFQDARVRQAVAHCLDRQLLIDTLLEGASEVPAVYVPSGHPYFAGDALARYDFNPAAGQALLAEAGWADSGSDGVRQRANQRLLLDLVSAPEGSPFRESLLGFIQAQLLDNCGIETRPTLHDAAELYSPWPNGPLFGRRFDLGTFPWRTGIEPPCDLYLTDAIPSDQNPGGANNTGYSNPEFDQACLAARQALDETERRERHQAAQVIFSQDLPSVPLFFRSRLSASSPRLQGYALDATAASDLWNIEALQLGAP